MTDQVAEARSAARKVALVTGGGSGIGRACAEALARAGFALVLAGRRRDRLAETASQIQAVGGEALVVGCDVTQEHQVRDLFGQAVERFGRVDVLFNNAGYSSAPAPIEDTRLEAWQTVVDTNLTGAFLCLREAFRVMKRQGGGRIINNGSVSAHVPRPNSAGYTATKHAITGLTKQAALEGRAHSIACGQIDIGNAATALLSGLRASGSPEPIMQVDNVADAIVYMATLPLSANVLFMTVMATNMPLVGRG